MNHPMPPVQTRMTVLHEATRLCRALVCAAKPRRFIMGVMVAVVVAGVSLPHRADAAGPVDVTDDLPPRVDLAALARGVERVYEPRLTTLWLEALARPEAGTRLEAAEAFNEALRADWPAAQRAGPRLVDAYRAETDVLVKRSLAEVMVRGEVAEAARIEWLDETDPAVRMTVDPALAGWGVDAADWWKGRVVNTSLSDAERVSAAAAWAAAGGSEAGAAAGDGAAATLAEVLRGDGSPALVVGVARAAGQLDAPEVVGVAGELAGGGPVQRSAAAAALAGSRGTPGARDILQRLLDADDPAVTAEALASLTQAAPDAAAEAAAGLVKHDDAAVRLAALRAAGGLPDDRALPLYAGALDDRSTRVRWAAREALGAMASRASADDDAVGEAATAVLREPGWRGLEQAAGLVGRIGYKPAAPRLAELLDHPRPEVRLAAATALRRVAVEATLPAALRRAEALVSAGPQGPARQDDDAELAQLLALIGSLRYAPADGLLRALVPKAMNALPNARLSAVWALGELHRGDPDAELAQALAARVNDMSELDPEDPQVQTAAVIALSKIDPAGTVASFRGWYGRMETTDELREAARRALEQATGEALPGFPAAIITPRGFFLEPLD